MTINIQPFQLVMMLGVVVTLVVFLAGWPRRKAIGGFYFLAFVLSVILWLVGATIENLVTDQNSKILWSQILYIGFVQACPYLFLFIISYSRQQNAPISSALALMVIPLITLVMAWTNSLHGWVWPGYSWAATGNNVLVFQHGFWFWVHVAYLYMLLAAGLVYLIRHIITAPPAIRSQLMIILAGILFPPVTGGMYTLGIVPTPGLDITPIGMIFTSIFFAWGLFRYQLLDLMPVARNALVEHLKDGVVVIDHSGRIVDFNSAANNLLGWDPKEIIGSDVTRRIPALEQSGSNSDEQTIQQVSWPGSPGKVLEVQSSILFSKNHQEIGKLLVIREITNRKKAEQALQEAHDLLEQRVTERTAELQRANVQLERASRMKDEFLANMSHELRTPLTGILGLSEVLQLETYGSLTEKQKTSMAHINASGRHLLNLINNILDLSKIEAGKLDLAMNTCSLADICQASLQMISEQASAKHMQTSFSITPDRITITADARRLKQIIFNLLSNAVKFTPDGGSCGIEVLGNREDHQVRITVWDTGIGIKEEDQARLFQPFVQLDASLTRHYSGAGLGLVLVSRLVELHGGSVTVQSAPWQGSRFIINLPWLESDEERVTTPAKPTAVSP